MKGSLKERFEAKYIPEPNSGCWLWFGANSGEGSTDDRAYGAMKLSDGNKSAHRISYEMHNGEIEDGMQVLHRCDMPCCVNPDHLFLGTVTDNMRDMTAKGRGDCARGVVHHKAKLNPEKAFEIRWHSAMWFGRREIARKYGITHGLVGFIVKNQIWKQECHD